MSVKNDQLEDLWCLLGYFVDKKVLEHAKTQTIICHSITKRHWFPTQVANIIFRKQEMADRRHERSASIFESVSNPWPGVWRNRL